MLEAPSYEVVTFNFSDDFFGSGLILSTQCDYSFRYMGEGRPMLQCVDFMLELDVLSTLFFLLAMCTSSDEWIAVYGQRQTARDLRARHADVYVYIFVLCVV